MTKSEKPERTTDPVRMTKKGAHMSLVTQHVRIDGMSCKNCERRVRDALGAVEGVGEISIHWRTGRGSISFDERVVSRRSLVDRLKGIGYRLVLIDGDGGADSIGGGWRMSKTAGAAVAVAGIAILILFSAIMSDAVPIPEISPAMGMGLLFVVGLLTGLHCIGMCGGFVIGYTGRAVDCRKRVFSSHLQYGAGKLLSYTLIGAGFGFVGSMITITPLMRAIAGVAAGLFLIAYGLSMLGLPWARWVRIPVPSAFSRFISRRSERSSGPLAIGLLNGLMIACGPLQAVYIMAAGTGSALGGAKLLFAFSLGTLPALFGFGYVTSLISAASTRKVLAASGVVVMILGVLMINRGLALSGTGVNASSLLSAVVISEGNAAPRGVEMKGGYQIIRMKVTRFGWEPDRFALIKGIPVRWIITGEEINSCNNAIVVPEYGLEFPVRRGEQVIEFTPKDEGVVSWSCWMGMIPGSFVVKDREGLAQDGGIDPVLDESLQGRSVCHTGATGGCCGLTAK